MIASVATAVTIEITGAMAIIHGTAVAGVELSFESSLKHVGQRLHQPVGPDAVGAVARLEAPEQLPLEQQDQRHHLEDEGEDHDRLHDLDERGLDHRQAPRRSSRSAPRAARRWSGPSRCRARCPPRGRRCRSAWPGAAPRWRARSRRRPLTSTSSPEVTPRRCASTGASSARWDGARKCSDGACSHGRPGPQRRPPCPRRRPSGSSGGCSSSASGTLGPGQLRGRVAVLPAHPACRRSPRA